MSTENFGELNPEEKAAFKRLKNQKMPSLRVEQKVINSLFKRGLLETRKFSAFLQNLSSPFRGAVVSIAAGLIFGLGFFTGTRSLSTESEALEAPLFALLIFNDNSTPEDEMALAAEYGQWLQGVAASGRLASGEKLQDTGRILSEVNGEFTTADIATDERYGQIGGFFLIQAASYDEAVEIASSCPHLKYEGSIEVREIHRF